MLVRHLNEAGGCLLGDTIRAIGRHSLQQCFIPERRVQSGHPSLHGSIEGIRE